MVASNTWAAIQGRDALTIDWDDGPNASYDSVAYRAQLEEATRQPGETVRNEGDAEAVLASAARWSRPSITFRIWPTCRWSRRWRPP